MVQGFRKVCKSVNINITANAISLIFKYKQKHISEIKNRDKQMH